MRDIQSCIEQLEQTSSLSKLISNKVDATTASTTTELSTLASKLESLKIDLETPVASN